MKKELKFRKTMVSAAVLNKLKPHPNNPRIHDPKQVESIGESIKRYGFLRAIVTWNGFIIAGEGSWRAAKAIKWDKSVPIVVANHLTEREAKDFMLSDNKLNEFSDWDWESLKDVLKDYDQQADKAIKDIDVQFPPGFLSAEIKDILNGKLDPKPKKKGTKKAANSKLIKRVECPKCKHVFEV